MNRQKDLFANDKAFKPHRIEHGGVTKGRRKIERPLTTKKPLHLTLKSSKAKGKLSFLNAGNKLEVEKIVRTQAEKFGVTIHKFENMGNHIHTIVKFKRREGFQNFLRSITAMIARKVTGARRGKPFGAKFWDALAHTRVITSYKDLKATENYLAKNETERDLAPEMRKAVEDAEKRMRKLKSEAMATIQKLERESKT